jgi:hypothetical protein
MFSTLKHVHHMSRVGAPHSAETPARIEAICCRFAALRLSAIPNLSNNVACLNQPVASLQNSVRGEVCGHILLPCPRGERKRRLLLVNPRQETPRELRQFVADLSHSQRIVSCVRQRTEFASQTAFEWFRFAESRSAGREMQERMNW